MKNLMGDLHADTIEAIMENSLNLNSRKLSFNTFDVTEYLPYIQLLACFVHDESAKNGYDRVNKMLNYYFHEDKKSNFICTIKRKEEIDKVIINNKLGVVLTVENGAALNTDYNNIYKLFDRGIRAMTITWNGENDLGCGNQAIYDTGLTKFGEKCIHTMNDIDMIVDVSHSSEKTFWDIAGITTKPIFASHSNASSICNHKRNLTDSKIKEIARLGGVIGITYYDKFLVHGKERASIDDVVKHIEYVCNLVGIDHVCVGSDFDGVNKINLPENLKGVKDIHKLEDCLLMRGFNISEIKKIMGENIKRFLKTNLP